MVTGWATVQIIISFFLAAALKHLWSLTDTLQFIIFTTTYWSIQVPAVAEAVINMLKYVALGEFIPYEILTDWIKEKFGQEPQNQEQLDEIENAGVSSDIFLQNLDSLLVVGLVMLIVLIFLALFSICKNSSDKVYKQYMIARNKVFWNMFIRSSLQSYLKMLFAVVSSL